MLGSGATDGIGISLKASIFKGNAHIVDYIRDSRIGMVGNSYS